MRAELTERYAPEPIPEYDAKMLDAGWPELGVYRDCGRCPIVRRIVAYEPIGWLVPAPKPARSPRKQKSRKEIFQEKIRRSERETSAVARPTKRFTT
jgi:hypothetical protein